MDPETIKQQNAAIKTNLAELTSTVEKYISLCESNETPESDSSQDVTKKHIELMESVDRMRNAVYGPVHNLLAHFTEFSYSGCTRALLEAGVFEAIPLDGMGISAADLAEKTKMEEVLLVRLMRLLVPRIFEEKTPLVYNQTPNSLIYQFRPLRQGFRMMYDEYAPTASSLTQYFLQNGYQEPTSIHNNPYTFAHRTNGLSMWEYLSQVDPSRLEAWNEAMQAQTSETTLSYAMFPFKEEYQKMGTTEESVLLVDIGGGKGQACRAIRELVGEEIEGRFVLQDRKETIEKFADEIEGVEKMAYDFFTEQPVKGALIYYIRRCLHDWPDEECIKILLNISQAMKSQPKTSQEQTSRLLISELVLPSSGAHIETAWMDITMLMFAGKERSEKEFAKLLDAAGLRLEKVHGAEGTNLSVLEAVLK